MHTSVANILPLIKYFYLIILEKKGNERGYNTQTPLATRVVPNYFNGVFGYKFLSYKNNVYSLIGHR